MKSRNAVTTTRPAKGPVALACAAAMEPTGGCGVALPKAFPTSVNLLEQHMNRTNPGEDRA